MKTTFYKSLKAFTLCAGFFSLAACKEKSIIKPDLIPGVDSINIFQVDTMSMSVKNSYYDSLWTNDYGYPIVGIGRISDDVFFGKTNQGVYLQFAPPIEGFSFPAGTIIDSTVLSIPYIYYAYGDSSSTNPSHILHMKAYRITDPFALGDGTRRYYSFDKLAYGTELASSDVTVKSLTDTVALASGDTVSNLLRIKMKPAMEDLFKTISPGDLSTTTAFLDFFKGIYLGPDTTKTQNTVGYFALNGGNILTNYANAQIEVYYHSTSSASLQKAFFKFTPSTCSFFNGIYRNYNGFPILNYLNNQTASRDSIIIEGYPGFRSDITIQLGNTIPISVINKASMTVTVLKTGDETRFSPPAKLLVRVVDADGTERLVSDMANADGTVNTAGQTFVDGSPVSVTIGNQQYTQYTLNIPREIQNAISLRKTEIKLRLSASLPYPGAFRMIADGPNGAAGTKLRFNVIYTKLNQ